MVTRQTTKQINVSFNHLCTCSNEISYCFVLKARSLTVQADFKLKNHLPQPLGYLNDGLTTTCHKLLAFILNIYVIYDI